MLHITNGDSVAQTLREAPLTGEYLSWRDVLHDGAVPGGLQLRQLSDVRARVLSEFGWGNFDGIRADFAQRDATLAAFRSHDEVVLWFEHDLYDQLQLIQLLDWLSRQDLGSTKLSIIQVNSYPGIVRFYGLGQLNASQLAALFPTRKNVTAEQLRAGSEAWAAFTSADPSAMAGLTQKQSSGLPFLPSALRRLLQEYPWVDDGLSRNEKQILRAVASGQRHRTHIYVEASRAEEVSWGDESLYLRMEWLASGRQPALARMGKNEYALTDVGKALLVGKMDWIESSGGIDRWFGGAHLVGEKAEWRWDHNEQRLRHG